MQPCIPLILWHNKHVPRGVYQHLGLVLCVNRCHVQRKEGPCEKQESECVSNMRLNSEVRVDVYIHLTDGFPLA